MRNLVIALLLAASTAAAHTPSPAPPAAKPSVSAAETRRLQAAALSYMEGLRVARDVKFEVELVRGGFARLRAVPPQGVADPAWVFLRKQAGKWKGVAGPGTAFESADLEKAGIPRELWPATK